MHLPHYPVELPQQDLQTWDDDENYCQANNDYIGMNQFYGIYY